MNAVLADPAKMIAKGAPQVIQSDKELEVPASRATRTSPVYVSPLTVGERSGG